MNESSDLKERPILVTGGAGFIGSCFVRRQLRRGAACVVVLDKLTYAGSPDNLAEFRDHPNVVFVQGDVADLELVGRLLREHAIGVVVHLAAETHVDRSIDDPWPFVGTNVLGTCRLLEATRRYWDGLSEDQKQRFRFVHVSTDEVFGALAGLEGAFDEQSPYRPSSPYAASKAAADHFVLAYGRTFGLPVIVTHCTNNYGPYQFPEKLIPLMILRALRGERLPVYGRGEQRRDWLFVEDHCWGLELAAARGVPGERYLFGSGCDRTNLEVVHAVCDAVDRLAEQLPHRPTRSLIEFVPDRPGHDFRYALDTQRTCRQLGWKPRTEFHQGIEATVRWYLEHPEWVAAVRRRYDLRRLGLG
ncbi:MAG: dTDP-glucose 4,6-dehydratase [Pirellulaceae bacterium]|nr:MAG: dTDP-glucose 4,6-dehydratase [Pirellulaceae bacterium]